MALLEKKGYGQVEPNHLSAQRNGQIYAQLPCDASIKTLENGQFVKYNYAEDKVDFAGEGEFMLVFNEVKLYNPLHTYKDFVYKVEDFTDKKMYPRVFKTMIGDIFTTNLVDLTTAVDSSKGVKLAPDAKGILSETAGGTAQDNVWKIVKVYTLADGQKAVKVQRIK